MVKQYTNNAPHSRVVDCKAGGNNQSAVFFAAVFFVAVFLAVVFFAAVFFAAVFFAATGLAAGRATVRGAAGLAADLFTAAFDFGECGRLLPWLPR